MKNEIDSIFSVVILLLIAYVFFFALASLILWETVFSPGQLSTTGRVILVIYFVGVIASISK